MTKQIEALKLALKWDEMRKYIMPYVVRDAIREALNASLAEQPAQTDWEAVAADQAMTIALLRAEQLAPVAEPHKQEPAAWMCHPFNDSECEFSRQQECENCIPLYTSPPVSKPWVSLTDEEMIIMSRYDLEYAALIGEVQRKLKEKNA